MTKLTICALFSILCVVPMMADDFKPISKDELALKDDPSARGAHAMLLEYREYRDDNDDYEDIYRRIKVFTEKGKEHADIEIPYDKGTSHITAIKARVVQPDGRVVPFEGKIFDKLIVKTRSWKFHAKTFGLPDVQPGSIIEYQYRRKYDDYRLRSNTWMLQEDLFMKKASFKLTTYPKVGSYWMSFGIPGGKQVKRKGQAIELDLENVPAFPEEKYAPPARHLKPRVEFFYSNVDVEKEPAKFWERIGKQYYSSVESFLDKKDQMRTAVATIVDPADPAETKLRKIYAKVQSLRNLSFERDKTEQEQKREKLKDTNNAKDVWDRAYGWRSDLNRLYVGLARAAGFESTIILTSRRNEVFFQEQLTDATQLDDEIAYVAAEGKEYFLDPGRPHCPFNMLSWSRTGVAGLKLAKGGGTFIKMPQPNVAMAVTRRLAKLKYTDTGLLGHVEVTYAGFDALERRTSALTDDEQSYREDLEEELKRLLPAGSTVKLAEIKNAKGTEEPLIVSFDVELPDISAQVGSRRMLPTAIFQMSDSNPFQTEKRHHPIYFSYPFQELDDVWIELPAGYAVDKLPSNRAEQSDFAQYDTLWEEHGRLLRMQRRMGIFGIYFPLEHYEKLRGFYNKIVAGDQDGAMLRASSAASR